MEKIKIIILSVKDIDISEYISKISESNDFILARKFTTDINEYEDKLYPLYLDIKTLNLSYKNNSFLYVTTDKNNISRGVTIDEYWASNIIFMDIEEFNLISDYTLGNNIIICWIDQSKIHDYKTINFNEIKIFENRLENINYLYFLNEDPSEFTNIVLKFINGNEEEKKMLLEEYS